MDWFYDKTITLLINTVGEMVNGVYVKGAPIEKQIACDVQPSSRSETYAGYGFFADSQYTVYCDVDTDIKEGKTVKYNGVEYSIMKLVDWDDYYILYLKAVD